MLNHKRKISILGSTGSIGRQTLEVVAAHPERFEVIGIAAKDELDILEEQINKFNPRVVSVIDETTALNLRRRFPPDFKTVIYHGEDGLLKTVLPPEVSLVVVAIVGVIALKPTLEAIHHRKDIALASKEILVAAGEIVMEEVRKQKVRILPVDSEHSAIFQCLQGEEIKNIRRLILTASGGAFRDYKTKDLGKVTAEDALKHPTWQMGPKITIDSATLMNKGLEVIEAHHLFGIDYDKIEVLIHPQSIIHSMVEFVDGSIKAQIGTPDMRLPIQYALCYPERATNGWPKLDLAEIKSLTFQKPDLQKFPCLGLAYEAGRAGNTVPARLNAANEEAVRLFLDGKITFLDIAKIVKKALTNHLAVDNPTLDDIISADIQVRGGVAC